MLAAWENDTGLRVQGQFDLITGTSTDGILAIGLGLGLSAQEILDFYKMRGPVIFPVTGFRRKLGQTIRQVFQPKFSQDVLRDELLEAFTDRKSGHSGPANTL